MTFKRRNQNKKPSVFHSARKFGALLPQAASLFVGLTAIAYFAGWRNVHAYYDTIGAPWLLSSLPPFIFLSVSAGLITTILIATFLIVLFAEDHEVKPSVFSAIALLCVVLAGAVSSVGNLMPGRWIGEETVFKVVQYGPALLATSVAFTFAQVIVQLSSTKHKWSTAMAFSVYTAVLLGLYAIPAEIGKSRAEQDLHATLSTMPLVQLGSENSRDQWRLVEIFGVNALVMSVPDKTGAHAFRVVEAKTLTRVSASKHQAEVL